MSEITAEIVKENIDQLIEDLKQLRFYLDIGATTGEYCNTKQAIINDYNATIESLKAYVKQEDFKELERLENEIKSL